MYHTDLEKCDFLQICNYLRQVSENRQNAPKSDKAAEAEIKKLHGHCIMDGHKQNITNYKIEPPALFRGRGDHPNLGRVKRR